jgi:hypothetical protein
MKYTEEENDFLKKYYNDKGQKWCANELKRTAYSVKNRARILDLKVDRSESSTTKILFTKEELKFLTENYSNLGLDYVSEHLNKTRLQIIKKVQKLKLKSSKDYIKRVHTEKTQEYWNNYEKPYEKYKVNPLVFKEIKNAETAYVLGLFWSDGHICYNKEKGKGKRNCIGIESVSEDLNTLKWIFESMGKWCFSTRKRENKKETLSIRTNNRQLVEFLISNDYDKKSKVSADKILTLIPEEFKNYFLLGFFDGDGCIYVGKDYRVLFSGTYEQEWYWLENILKELNINYTIRKVVTNKNNKFSELRFGKIKNILSFYNYIYKDYNENKIGLFRKYEKMNILLKERDLI